MWILKKLTGEVTKYLITGKHSYSVGRKNCDIKFEDDTSISRKHCTIYISNKNNCPFPVNTPTGVWIVDEQSKYGTFLCKHGEWVKINHNQNETLSDGSVVRFGLMENIFRLEYKPVTACASGISTVQKKEIENSLKLIDGELSNGWRRDCSLVIVREIALTVKVVLALINGVPIVLPQYIQKLVDSIRNQTPPPDCQSFLPNIKESVLKTSLVSLDPKDNRKELFKGKQFLIPTKAQLDTLKEIITSAGGMVELLSCNGSWERFVDENVIVIQAPVNDTDGKLTNTFKKISAFLNNSNRRVVPESEIAQAVAYSSTKKYCNPECGAFSLRKTQRQIDSGSMLVDATPEASSQIPSEYCVIPSSSRFSFNDTDLEKNFPETPVAGRKRIRSPEKEETECPKAKERKNEKTSNEGNASVKKPQAPKKSSLKEWVESELKRPPEKDSGVDSDFFSNLNSRFNKRPRPPSPKPSNNSSEDGNDGIESCNPSKRKLPDETCDGGSPSSKKTRLQLLEEVTQDGAAKPNPIRESVDVEVGAEEPRARGKDACEDDLETFIEKGKAECAKATIEELYNTILSLQLVPSLFLKEDKSLIEPPSVLTNIKKFKKRGASVEVSRKAASEGTKEEFSGGDWVEPHLQDSRFHFLGEDE